MANAVDQTNGKMKVVSMSRTERKKRKRTSKGKNPYRALSDWVTNKTTTWTIIPLRSPVKTEGESRLQRNDRDFQLMGFTLWKVQKKSFVLLQEQHGNMDGQKHWLWTKACIQRN